MSFSFWDERWQADKTGWHRDRVSPELLDHFEAITGGHVRRALVPLCGKSVDLRWLAERADEVVGVEFVERAAQTFFAQHALEPTVEETPLGARYVAGNLSILCADVLTVTPAVIGQFDFVFDRAAIIALDEAARATYADTIASLCQPEADGLLVSLGYDQSAAHGPPFAVNEDELVENLGPSFQLRRLEQAAVSDMPDRFAGTPVTKKVWHLKRSSHASGHGSPDR